MSWTRVGGIVGILGLLAAVYFPVANAKGLWPFSVSITYGSIPQIELFRADPESIDSSGVATLQWSVSNTSHVTINPGIGPVALSGSRSVTPSETTTYTLIATNEYGDSTATTTVEVVVTPVLPDLVITDIFLKSEQYADDVIVNTVVRNNGAEFREAFIVWCYFLCSENTTYFSGMRVHNGLDQNQEITLGNDSLLYLGDCSFKATREFT